MTQPYNFQEPESADYIFIDPDNHVHVLVPLVGGHTISTDNTCKTNAELKTFLGIDDIDEHGQAVQQTKPSVLTILKKYREALEYDIALLQHEDDDNDILSLKVSRLEQINAYIAAVEKLLKPTIMEETEEWEHHGAKYSRVKGSYEVFEDEIIYQKANDITNGKNNCLGIRLSIDPQHEDPAVKIPSPLFAVNRSTSTRVAIPGLGTQLRQTFSQPLRFADNTALEKILATVPARFKSDKSFDFKVLQQFLQQQIEQQYAEKVDLSISTTAGFSCTLYTFPSGKLPKEEAAIIKQGDQYHIYGYSNQAWKLTPLDSEIISEAKLPFPDISVKEGAFFTYSPTNNQLKEMYQHIQRINAHFPIIDQEYYRNDLYLDDNSSWNEYAIYILQTCLSSDFWDGLANLFIENDPEKLSIKVQFFLAQINVHCYENTLSTQNFGLVFDDPRVAGKIANAVKKALEEGEPSVEDALFSIVDENYRRLGLARKLTPDDKDTIIKNFNIQFKTVDSPGHKFDEFLIFRPNRKGNYAQFKGRISYHLADLMAEMFPSDKRDFKVIRDNRRHFAAYEGTYLPLKNDNLSRKSIPDDNPDLLEMNDENSMEILLSKLSQPEELAVFLCQTSNDGRFLFEVYPYAASFLQGDPDLIVDIMLDAVQPDDLSQPIHLFITGYDVYDEGIRAYYPEPMFSTPLEQIDEELTHIGSEYKKLRSWVWTRHKNRAGQLKEIDRLLELTKALDPLAMSARNRVLFLHDVLKKLENIYNDIQGENPWRRYFLGDTYLQRVVKAAGNSIMRQLDIASDDIPHLSNPEEKVCEDQTTTDYKNADRPDPPSTEPLHMRSPLHRAGFDKASKAGDYLPLQKLSQSIDIMCRTVTGKGKGILQGLAKYTQPSTGSRLFPTAPNHKKIKAYQKQFDTQLTVISDSLQALQVIKKNLIAKNLDLDQLNESLTACHDQLSAACDTYKKAVTIETQVGSLNNLLGVLETTIALSNDSKKHKPI